MDDVRFVVDLLVGRLWDVTADLVMAERRIQELATRVANLEERLD